MHNNSGIRKLCCYWEENRLMPWTAALYFCSLFSDFYLQEFPLLLQTSFPLSACADLAINTLYLHLASEISSTFQSDFLKAISGRLHGFSDSKARWKNGMRCVPTHQLTSTKMLHYRTLADFCTQHVRTFAFFRMQFRRLSVFHRKRAPQREGGGYQCLFARLDWN